MCLIVLPYLVIPVRRLHFLYTELTYVDCVDLENSEDEDTGENDRSCFLVSVESKPITEGFSSLVAKIQVNR
jgi:hypothetical protein